MSVGIVTAVKANSILCRFVAPSLGCHCNHQFQSIRCKGRKKQPSQTGQKEVWLSKTALQRAKTSTKQIPKNWDKFLARKPEDDIWIKTYFPPVKYSAAEALDMHREIASPEMLNNTNGSVLVDVELNMSTSKRTKFIAAFNGVLLLPHNFDDGTENKVLAFCRIIICEYLQTKEEREISVNEGALFAGGADVMGQQLQFLFVFPGAVGADIGVLVHYFRLGKNYSCEKEGDNFAKMQVNIGQLNMKNEELVENLKAYIERINFHRAKNIGKTAGNFITKAYLLCPPSGEKVYLKDEELVSDKNAGNPIDQITTLTFAAEKSAQAMAN
ncbi:hypothetical protein LSH36_207g04026 [Paralvinella palmiformis]|uniref:Uncharacterized protein n=1 Tax=Paralvinella palmiformis TaxID=53620 RepID=A0AAD9JPT8_9ANNE|nr:hypothetical protein LSH36_207g04026 [Paralvinella palmiformis]